MKLFYLRKYTYTSLLLSAISLSSFSYANNQYETQEKDLQYLQKYVKENSLEMRKPFRIDNYDYFFDRDGIYYYYDRDGSHNSWIKIENTITSPSPKIVWNSCSKKVRSGNNEIKLDYECGKIQVPVVWSKPNGQKINVALVRLKAKNSAKRVGALVMNPGGPGSSSIDMAVNSYSDTKYQELAKSFDLIGMDPRGVGESTPIKCSSKLSGKSLYPENETEFNAMIKENEEFYDSCYMETGELLNYVDTTNVVRDLDAVRSALGEEKLNFFGISYGTSIAATYAELFPDNSRALVLDSVLDHSRLTASEFGASQAKGVENNFMGFVRWCDNDIKCKANNTSILTLFENVVQNLNTNPIKTSNKDIIINGYIYTSIIKVFLFGGEKSWADISNYLIIAPSQGNYDALIANTLNLAHLMNNDSNRAISCADYSYNVKTWDEFLKYKQTMLAASKLFYSTIDTVSVCAGWKSIAMNPPHKLNITKEQPALLIGVTYDPATPYEWAQNIFSQIPGSSFINYKGFVHGGYKASACVRNLVNHFLITGEKPAQSITCED
jgi:pimeloyl-ACP methyl ester carboxylesterase